MVKMMLVTHRFWRGFNCLSGRHYQCTPIDFGGSVVRRGRYFSAGAQFPGPMTTREGKRRTTKIHGVYVDRSGAVQLPSCRISRDWFGIASRRRGRGGGTTTGTPGGPIPAAPGMTNTRNTLGVRPHLGVVNERCRGWMHRLPRSTVEAKLRTLFSNFVVSEVSNEPLTRLDWSSGVIIFCV